MSPAADLRRSRPGLGVTGSSRSARPRRFYAWLGFLGLAKLLAVVLLLHHDLLGACAAFFAPAPWLVWQVTAPSADGLGPAVNSFAAPGRAVWLTIDDGPDPATTPRLLDLLDAHQARATFFLIGRKVARHPGLVAEILRRGHTVGNHTLTHPCFGFWCASTRRTAGEIDAGTAALRRAGAGVVPWFRPPAGLKNLALHRQLAARNLPLVLWNVRSLDTLTRRPAASVARMARRIRPGAIILLHEGRRRSGHHVAILAGLLAHLRREGYACVIPAPDSLGA